MAIFTDGYTGITEVTSLSFGDASAAWRKKGSECPAPTINEETLQTAVIKAINELLANKAPFLLIENVTIFDDKLTVEFKSGVEIDIKIE